MHILYLPGFLLIFMSSGCERAMLCEQTTQAPLAYEDMTSPGKGALLLTRFKSLDDLKEVIDIRYFHPPTTHMQLVGSKSMVKVKYKTEGATITSILRSGVSQGDIAEALKGSIWDRLLLVIRNPYLLESRTDLMRVYALSRRRDMVFGAHDVAFYDIAETMAMENISDTDIAAISSEDLSEKGYLNTFNHITSQAFMTTLFSERLADFIADIHERHHIPELITGQFSDQQIADLENGPVDNYVDLINNEWGQELGKLLKIKYGICRSTKWTPGLVAEYLNELQAYCGWSFGIAFKPFRSSDDIVIKFAQKLNAVMLRAPDVEVG